MGRVSIVAIIWAAVLAWLVKAEIWVAKEIPARLIVRADGEARVEFEVMAGPTQSSVDIKRPVQLPVFQEFADGVRQRGLTFRVTEREKARLPQYVEWSPKRQQFRVRYSFYAVMACPSVEASWSEAKVVSFERNRWCKESDGIRIFYWVQGSDDEED